MKLADARRIALALPEAAEAPHFDFTSFRVRGKIFATAPPDGAHLHVFVGDEDRERVLELHPEFAEKLWWGKKVVGVRVKLAAAKTAVVKDLLERSWQRKAPKALVKG
jgi:hypothetical protein